MARWTKPRRVIAKVEWRPGEPYPRVGFIVTNMCRPAKRVVDGLASSTVERRSGLQERTKFGAPLARPCAQAVGEIRKGKLNSTQSSAPGSE